MSARRPSSREDGPMRLVLTPLVLLLLLIAMLGCGVQAGAESQPRSSRSGRIDYAVDGDTLRVRLPGGDLDYVRLVGIDTPEDVRPGYPIECGARAAAASMHRLAPDGIHLTLRRDSVAGVEDRYGRLLAHAFVDGRQLEIVQLRRGLAYVYRYEDQRFDGLRRFEAVANAARQAARGSWGRCNGDFHSAEPGVQD